MPTINNINIGTINNGCRNLTINVPPGTNPVDLVRAFMSDKAEDIPSSDHPSSSAATNESQSQPSSPAPDVKPESPADKAILAVHNAGICEPSDWAAVIRLFKEREMMQPNGQPFDAAYINRVCGKPVTSESSISRSIMSTKIGGKYPYWRIKQDEETRQTPNKLRLYNEIGRIASEALQ